MKNFKGSIILILLVCLAAVPALSEGPSEVWTGEDYIIGPGDVLEVSVWKEEALSKLLTVLPDGKITFPLVGEVVAGGMTVAQLKKDIESRLVRFVPDPVLTVGVHQVNSMMVYVIGKVNNPGRFTLNTNINVMQALAMAGGLNPFAKRDEIRVFRNRTGKTSSFEFDYDEVADGKNLAQNILLLRGDVIVVP